MDNKNGMKNKAYELDSEMCDSIPTNEGNQLLKLVILFKLFKPIIWIIETNAHPIKQNRKSHARAISKTAKQGSRKGKTDEDIEILLFKAANPTPEIVIKTAPSKEVISNIEISDIPLARAVDESSAYADILRPWIVFNKNKKLTKSASELMTDIATEVETEGDCKFICLNGVDNLSLFGLTIWSPINNSAKILKPKTVFLVSSRLAILRTIKTSKENINIETTATVATKLNAKDNHVGLS